MSLIRRPAAAGDRLTWRRPAAHDPASVALVAPPLATVPDPTSADLVRRDVELERIHGINTALDRLAARTGTPTYRRARALAAVCRSVERQACIAGLGHVHVGTPPCGPMCQPLGQHAHPWRGQ